MLSTNWTITRDQGDRRWSKFVQMMENGGRAGNGLWCPIHVKNLDLEPRRQVRTEDTYYGVTTKSCELKRWEGGGHQKGVQNRIGTLGRPEEGTQKGQAED